MRKILHALAALAVIAGITLAWTPPAQAAPGGSCSVEEWANPTSWSDCAKRLGVSVNDKTGCVTAPSPGSPTEGMAGWFTSQPDSALRPGVQGPYSRYGVGGYGLDTYDLGCLGTVKDPGRASDTWLADKQFQAAASMMGAANGLREYAYNPHAAWSWSDGFLNDVTQATYKYVFHPVGALAVVMIGIFLIYRARRGQVQQAIHVTGWAILITVVVTAVAKWPVEAAHGFDAAGTKGLAVVQTVLGPAKQDIPGMCPLGEAEDCKDNRDPATRASDVAVDTVLYQSWLRAVLGDSESQTAQKYGPMLYDATAMEWGEAARANQSPQLRQQLIDIKAQRWNEVAAQIRVEDPIAYEYLQGKHGSDRTGAGFIAVMSAMIFSAFDLVASLIILLSFGLIRVGILFLPVVGTLGVFYFTSAGVQRIGRMASAAFFNIIVFGGYDGVYLMGMDRVFRSDMPGWLKIVVVGLLGAGGFIILHPFRHLYSTATGRARKESSVVARAMVAAKQIRADNDTEKSLVDDAIADAAARGEAPVRPENRRYAKTVHTVASAGAPTATQVATTPPPLYVTARDGIAERPRPEEKNHVNRAKSLVGAVVNAVGDAHLPAAPATPAGPAPQPAPSRPENRK